MDWGPRGFFNKKKFQLFDVAQLVWIQEDLAKFCYQPDMKILQYLRFLLCFGFLVEPTFFFSIFRVPNFDENFQNSRKFSQIYTKICSVTKWQNLAQKTS